MWLVGWTQVISPDEDAYDDGAWSWLYGIQLNWNWQQKSSQKGVLQFLQKIRKFKMAVIFGKNFVKK